MMGLVLPADRAADQQIAAGQQIITTCTFKKTLEPQQARDRIPHRNSGLRDATRLSDSSPVAQKLLLTKLLN